MMGCGCGQAAKALGGNARRLPVVPVTPAQNVRAQRLTARRVLVPKGVANGE